MDHGFGSELPRKHSSTPHRPPARYVVLIDSGGSTVVRLFLENRTVAAEFDAGAEEASRLTQGLVPIRGATAPEWDHALEGHSAEERAAAEVYTLPI
ncbi:hypothetical protein C7444_101130 [Sphaerotilus hippei]|uniref:Uncharacterized protein n=1 Tax=Sphaerotilus hippei TaxID=744406 RepID=A0A318H5T9_9BURK|nr:hypothetical protein [Sphaerotilus hippei]PXW99300.1 hypothetical protein C7444_101130 [Sphaerotilus hippei]